MSTRCQIGFYQQGEQNLEKWEALIYRHSDGYPDTQHGVVATVLPILKDFDKNRGLDDIEYASAWLVTSLKTDYLNIGISNKFHYDIEYFYAVFTDGTVKIFDTHGNITPVHWELLNTININEIQHTLPMEVK
jgi:hypothetical protein